MRRMTLTTTALLAALTAGALAQDRAALVAEPVPVELPLTRAVLLASGVGYFEHAGAVEGSGAIRLAFKADQINDVLKSMVLMDLDGGSLSTVTYPSNDPVERALKGFAVDISANPTLSDLLQQLRGAEVTIAAPDRVTGSILNVETRTSVTGEPPATTIEHILHLVSDSGIRSFPLRTISGIELADPKLRDELNRALGLLVSARDSDRRPVDIRFEGKGTRRVRIGYLVEAPIWKTSYRLDLSNADNPSADDAGKPLLQGWAIVENTSDNDWDDVTLTLVSGRPISFVQDLYTPLYLPRPLVVPERYASLQPRMYEEGIELERAADKDAGHLSRVELRAKAPMAPAAAKPAEARWAAGQDAAFFDGADQLQFPWQSGGVASIAEAASLGELFQFTIAQPVDLARRRSAMLPIVNEAVTAEKVSIYNQGVLAKHPLNGAILTNTTDLKLPDGPITVFDGGSYAGDAQVDHLPPGDKRLLSYAIDLSVTVDPSVKTAQNIIAGKIDKGVLSVTRLHAFNQTYAIKNKAGAAKNMIIEHPFDANRTLLEPKEFEEKTPNLYRFRLPIEAGKTTEFIVREEQRQSETIALLDQPVNTLQWYSTSGQVPEPVRKALAKAIELKNQLAGLEAQAAARTQELAEIQQGQGRVRENIQSVGVESTLGKRYIAKLNEEEDKIEQLQAQIAELRKQIDAKRAELSAYVSNLNVGA